MNHDPYAKLIDHIGYLLNSIDPEEDLGKLVAIELTTNQESHEWEYHEVVNVIIQRLSEFYHSEELLHLWNEYLSHFEDEEDEISDFDDVA